jgi:hypothetical protein
MKVIDIVPLARKKMKQRSIPEKWVCRTIDLPQQIVAGYQGRSVAHGRFRIQGKEKLLRVVFEETSEKYIVITAYLTSDIKRYWKEM